MDGRPISRRAGPERLRTLEQAFAYIYAREKQAQADVSQESDVESFVGATVVRFGRLDVAINNAAKEIAGPTLDLPSKDFDTLIDTNLKGNYFGRKH